jgi:4-alpha-glucanotransferase
MVNERTWQTPRGNRDEKVIVMARASGILLHPTSLPGPYGVGDLGPSARQLIDFLAAADQTYWQILPLGPTGYGDSPYQTFSAFAGNPLLVSPRLLVDDGLLPDTALDDVPSFPNERVDFAAVIPYKRRLLERAFAHRRSRHAHTLERAVDDFAAAHSAWLEPFALFMALKDAHGGRPWTEWEPDIAARDPDALARWSKRLAEEMQGHVYNQYLFFSQWNRLKRYAGGRGIRVIGDAPIFVAHDSADCWANRDLFYLEPDGTPSLIAGVPPDYFSATGQRWGNPLYRWDVMATDRYQWWIDRLRQVLTTVDVLRLDHFRGFAGYWAIPGNAPTAEIGCWEPGPGIPFFAAVEQALGHLPIIAEDLGVITPDVEALRNRFGFPGMRVLQFAFDSFEEGPDNPHLPHNHVQNTIVYTGTHDNDTTAGWYGAASLANRTYVREYAHAARKGAAAVAWDMIRMAQASVAHTAVAPLQDVLGLGSAARMNVPGVPGGNWQWRFEAYVLTDDLATRLANITRLYGRAPAHRPIGDIASPDSASPSRRTSAAAPEY